MLGLIMFVKGAPEEQNPLVSYTRISPGLWGFVFKCWLYSFQGQAQTQILDEIERLCSTSSISYILFSIFSITAKQIAPIP